MIIKRNNRSIELSESTLEIIIEYFDGYGMMITDSDLIKKRIKQLNKYKIPVCSGKDFEPDENGHLYEVVCECWYCKPITKGVIVGKHN